MDGGGTRKLSLSHWGAFTATVEGGRLVAAEPWRHDDPAGPVPGGADPAMIAAWPELVHSPTRVDRPYAREGWLAARRAGRKPDGTGRGHEPMLPLDWDEALDLVAGALDETYRTHGPEAVFGGSYGWSSAGRFHHARTQVRRFLATAGGFVDQIGNYSWGAAQTLLPHVLGDFSAVSSAATAWETVVSEGDLVVAFGGLNPKNWRVTSGGAGYHHLPDWTRRARAAGVEFVVVSPFAGDAPDWLEARRIAPRPNSDTAIMLALARAMVRRGRADRDFLARYCDGVADFLAYLAGETDGQEKTLAWAAEIADVPVTDLERLADRIAASPRVMLTTSWSLQRAEHGEQPFWATVALAAILGHVGLPGGGFTFGYGSMNAIGEGARRGYIPAMEVPANPIAGRAIPVARVIDMLERPGATIDFNGRRITYPEIRLVYWAGGNPFHHVQDLNRAAAAWSRPETIIVHEPWWTPTARRADVVLPATTTAERSDIGGNSRDPFAFFMDRLIEPVGEARDDFAIFADLAGRLGCREAFTEGRDTEGWLRHLWSRVEARAAQDGLNAPDFETFRADGYWAVPRPAAPELLLGAFRADPSAKPLKTPSGRIQLSSPLIARMGYDDCPGHPAWLPPREWLGAPDRAADMLHLVSHQPPGRLHGQLYQTAAGRAHDVAGREPVRISPADAAERGIADGAPVRLWNGRGEMLAGAVVDAGVRPGVLVMATGAWWDPDPEHPGRDRAGNPNALTRDVGTSRLTQACAALSALVQIAPM